MWGVRGDRGEGMCVCAWVQQLGAGCTHLHQASIHCLYDQGLHLCVAGQLQGLPQPVIGHALLRGSQAGQGEQLELLHQGGLQLPIHGWLRPVVRQGARAEQAQQARLTAAPGLHVCSHARHLQQLSKKVQVGQAQGAHDQRVQGIAREGGGGVHKRQQALHSGSKGGKNYLKIFSYLCKS